MCDWLVPALGLPAKFLSTAEGGGVLQDSASSATLCALVAARERATEGRYRTEGGAGLPRMVVYASDQVAQQGRKRKEKKGKGKKRKRKRERGKEKEK